MLIMLAIIALVCGGGMYGSYRAGRRVQRIRGAKTQALLAQGAQTEFERLLDESRICVGELLPKDKGQGPLFGHKFRFAGLELTGLHSFSIGTLIAASWEQTRCVRCKSQTHYLFEVAERKTEDGKLEHFARHLCTLCLSSGCGRIVHLSSYHRSERYAALVDASANAQELLEKVRDLRESHPYDALEAKERLALPAPTKTETA